MIPRTRLPRRQRGFLGISAGVWALIGATVASAGASYYSSSDASRTSQHQAQDAQKAMAAAAASDANKPQTQAPQNPGMAAGAPGSNIPPPTFLTGPGGIDPGVLQLSKSAILGGNNKLGQ